jgi:hypothetical protein
VEEPVALLDRALCLVVTSQHKDHKAILGSLPTRRDGFAVM